MAERKKSIPKTFYLVLGHEYKSIWDDRYASIEQAKKAIERDGEVYETYTILKASNVCTTPGSTYTRSWKDM